MSLKLNRAAVDHALQLLADGKYALNTVWTINQPSATQIDAYRAANGDESCSKWFLAVDEHGYTLPSGDLNRVHRSGVVAAKRAAENAGQHDMVEAIEEILDLFDRLNAC